MSAGYMTIKRLLLVVAATFQLGCLDGAGESQVNRNTADFQHLAELKRASDELVRFVGGPDSFGSIDELQLVQGGRMAILDRMNGQIALYSEDDKELFRFGQRGHRPGEFLYPVSLAVVSGHLVVLDKGNLRLSWLIVEGDSLRLGNELRIPLPASDMCVFDGRMFLLGLHEGRLLHELDTDAGRLTRSFAPVEGDAIDQMLASLAHLACSARDSAFAVVPETIGELKIYDLAGRLRASASIPDYEGVVYIKNGNSVRYEDPPLGYAHVAKTALWHNGHVLIQLERTPGDGTALREGRSYSLAMQAWESSQRLLRPEILLATDSLFFVADLAPFPVVGIYESQG